MGSPMAALSHRPSGSTSLDAATTLAAAQARPQHVPPSQFLVLDLVQPGQSRLECEGAAGEHHRVPEVRRRHLEAERPQEVRRVLGHRPLRHAEVAGAPHDQAAVEPGLGRHPVERRLAVHLLVAHRDELAPGSERPPTALHDDLVAALGVQAPERAHDRAPVGRADEHGGQSTRRRPVCRVPAVGDELDAVGHLRGESALDGNGRRARRGELDGGCCDPAPHGHARPPVTTPLRDCSSRRTCSARPACRGRGADRLRRRGAARTRSNRRGPASWPQ